MIISIEKEITLSTGRFWQPYILRAEIEVIDDRAWVRPEDGTVTRRRPLSERYMPAGDLWELLSYNQQQEFVEEAKEEAARATGLVVQKVGA